MCGEAFRQVESDRRVGRQFCSRACADLAAALLACVRGLGGQERGSRSVCGGSYPGGY